MAKQLILCDCLGTQAIDRAALSAATGMSCSRVHHALCTTGIDAAEAAIRDGDAIIACAQEAARFAELAGDLGCDAPAFVDVRDRAGWGDGADATAKMAALIAEAALPAPAVKALDVLSEGRCLVIGPAEVACAAAATLAETLAVTVLITDDGAAPALRGGFEVVRGRIRRAEGTLGRFTLHLDALAKMQPGGRGDFGFAPPRDGAETGCDVILDLSGAAPLFPAPEKRDGYLRADPRAPLAVAAAVFQAARHVGTFEKPLHVALAPELCAHSRAGQTGCTRCLDACPTGAIRPDGDHVAIDALICAGCGACSALCPSGAITYDAPATGHDLTRMRVLAETYRSVAGHAPRLLVHDTDHGASMIALAARHGPGLPAAVIPLAVAALAGFGHAEMLAALALGFATVDLLLAPGSDRDTIARETALAEAMGGAGRLRTLDLADPEALAAALREPCPADAATGPVLPMGSRRQVARLAARALLAGDDTPLPLPEGAPYGAVLVDTGACTLCLSCASLCPSGALGDNPDMPQLRFQEDACLQCGLCATICPEDAIRLVPRFDPSDAALAQVVLHEEEPFACIECGKLFGVRSTVETIVEKLAGKHAMFADSAAARLIRMCDDCRVRTSFHGQDNPFAAADRPRVRTTDDYLSKRRDH